MIGFSVSINDLDSVKWFDVGPGLKIIIAKIINSSLCCK